MAFRGNNVFVREQAQKRLVEIGELFACAEIVDQHRVVKARRQHLRELSVARQIAKIGIGRGIAGNNLLRQFARTYCGQHVPVSPKRVEAHIELKFT